MMTYHNLKEQFCNKTKLLHITKTKNYDAAVPFDYINISKTNFIHKQSLWHKSNINDGAIF